MPELPEVETTCRGITPHICGQEVTSVIVRQSKLRWPIPSTLARNLSGKTLLTIQRRAKYLLFRFSTGYLLMHLGMSGSLRITTVKNCPGKHDHVDLIFANNKLLRFTDPRRFGAILWLGESPEQHKLLQHLGPEPLSNELTGSLLYQRSRGKKLAIKQFIMDQKIVTGVGNIYANEALFNSGIKPITQAGRISQTRYEILVTAIQQILTQAIDQGGTTLRDFVGSDGRPGYFKQQLQVYGRSGLPCMLCQQPLTEIRQSGRSTIYCQQCQR
jgi:formamidopyrimidine-DNA glycosylase